jgi:hypothetical protein
VTRLRIAPARIVPRDAAQLELRARELAAEGAETEAQADAAAARRLVVFRLRGLPCAVEAACVERAVSRLLGVAAVPMATGPDRNVAFVEEQPVPVIDLLVAAGAVERSPAALSAGPALVVATAEGSVAVAVEGPLDLREERLAGTVGEALRDGEGPRLAGRLGDGTSVLDAAWLAAWAGEAARA